MVHLYREGAIKRRGLNIGWVRGPVIMLRWSWGDVMHDIYFRLSLVRFTQGRFKKDIPHLSPHIDAFYDRWHILGMNKMLTEHGGTPVAHL